MNPNESYPPLKILNTERTKSKLIYHNENSKYIIDAIFISLFFKCLFSLRFYLYIQ